MKKQVKKKQNNTPLIVSGLALLGILVGYTVVKKKSNQNTNEEFENSFIDDVEYTESKPHQKPSSEMDRSRLVFFNAANGKFKFLPVLRRLGDLRKSKNYSGVVAVINAMSIDRLRYFHNQILFISKGKVTLFEAYQKSSIPDQYKLQIFYLLNKAGVGKNIKSRL